jgi:G3E family GTPase
MTRRSTHGGIGGREQRAHRTALRVGEEHRLRRARGLHHRTHIVHALLEHGHALEAVGQALAALVEADDAKAPLDALLVLADAETLRERAADRYVGELVRQQLHEADLLLLNKTDLLADSELPALRDWLAATAPRSRVLCCHQARLPPELLLGIGPLPAAPRRRVKVARAGTRFDSLSLEFEHRVDMAALAALLAAPPLRLLRAKGWMRDREGQPRALQVVGRRSTLTPPAHELPHSGRLVCIARRGELQAERIRAALAACAA